MFLYGNSKVEPEKPNAENSLRDSGGFLYFSWNPYEYFDFNKKILR